MKERVVGGARDTCGRKRMHAGVVCVCVAGYDGKRSLGTLGHRL